MADRSRAQGRIRVSGFAYSILIVCALELLAAILSLVLPWGLTSSGSDIKSGLEGLLPWFLFVPVLLQLGFLVLDIAILETLYLVVNFVISFFVLATHYITYLKYGPDLSPGFYLVFVAGGLAVIATFIGVFEKHYFYRLLSSGKARLVPIFGHVREEASDNGSTDAGAADDAGPGEP